MQQYIHPPQQHLINFTWQRYITILHQSPFINLSFSVWTKRTLWHWIGTYSAWSRVRWLPLTSADPKHSLSRIIMINNMWLHMALVVENNYHTGNRNVQLVPHSLWCRQNCIWFVVWLDRVYHPLSMLAAVWEFDSWRWQPTDWWSHWRHKIDILKLNSNSWGADPSTPCPAPAP